MSAAPLPRLLASSAATAASTRLLLLLLLVVVVVRWSGCLRSQLPAGCLWPGWSSLETAPHLLRSCPLHSGPPGRRPCACKEAGGEALGQRADWLERGLRWHTCWPPLAGRQIPSVPRKDQCAPAQQQGDGAVAAAAGGCVQRPAVTGCQVDVGAVAQQHLQAAVGQRGRAGRATVLAGACQDALACQRILACLWVVASGTCDQHRPSPARTSMHST